MTSNLEAWLESATPMTEDEMEEFIKADMEADARRYGFPKSGAFILECYIPREGDDSSKEDRDYAADGQQGK